MLSWILELSSSVNPFFVALRQSPETFSVVIPLCRWTTSLSRKGIWNFLDDIRSTIVPWRPRRNASSLSYHHCQYILHQRAWFMPTVGDPDVHGLLNVLISFVISLTMIRHWHTTGILHSICLRCSLHRCQSIIRFERSPRRIQPLQHRRSQRSLHSTNRIVNYFPPSWNHTLQHQQGDYIDARSLQQPTRDLRPIHCLHCFPRGNAMVVLHQHRHWAETRMRIQGFFFDNVYLYHQALRTVGKVISIFAAI